MNESDIQGSAGSIFICYRRHDSADVTGRIYDRLADHFGSERVFIDVEAIRLGYDFRSEIDQTIKVCSVVIVVIGDEWLAEVDGKRRIDDENDRVRIEIESALRREIPIIPVLTRGASHPTKAMLPASLEALAYRNGTSIRHEHFRTDMDSLITQMEKLFAPQESTPSKPAEPKEPTPPMKSTPPTTPPPAIPPVASTPAIATFKEPAGWKRKRLIIVTAIGATVILLLAITGAFMRRHESVSPATPAGQAPNPAPTATPAATVAATSQMPAGVVAEDHSRNTAAALKALEATATVTATATSGMEPAVSLAASIPNFAGIWKKINPKDAAHPMRLKVVQSGDQIACYITHTEVFDNRPFLQAIISQGKATTSHPQGCPPKFRKPGYNYDNPGVDIFSINLRGSTLVYEQESKWTSPCDGHPIGTEQRITKLQRVSQ